jgi:hypothetical protein
MANETHNGELNRSKAPAPAKSEGTSGAKSNDCEASLRRGSLPPASQVTTLPLEGDKTIAPKCAKVQNVSLTSDGTKILNVIPNSGKAVLTHPSGGELQ